MSTSTWRYPGVARLICGGSIAEVADWMLLVALPLFVLGITESPLITSVVFVLQTVLSLVSAPLAGLLIDRADPWHLMGGTAALQVVAILPLLFVESIDQLWIVYIIAVVQSVLGAIIEPARPAVAASLVPSDRVAPVNQLLGIGSGLARLIGAPLGTVALSLGGADVLVIATGVAYAFAAVVLFHRARARRDAGRILGGAETTADDLDPMPASAPESPAVPARSGLVAELLSGVGVVWRDPTLRRLMLLAMLMAIAQGLFTILFVLWVPLSLGGGDAEIGVLRGVQAIGALVAGLGLLGVVAKIPPARLAAASIGTFGVLSLIIWNLPAATTWFPLYVGLFIVVGAPGLVATTAILTIVERSAPATHRGRVTSLLFAVLTAFQSVGTLAGGFVGTGPGFIVALQVQGALYLAAAALALTLRPGRPGRPARDRSRVTPPR